MAQIAKILPIPVEHRAGEQSISNSLAEKGIMRYPGTSVGIVPIKESNGKFKTGLDPDATYIRMMIDPKAKKLEIEKVTERKERLEKETGLDLGPKSEYYSGVYGVKYGTNEVANRVKLIDGVNTFNFNDPFKEVEFWWVIQNIALVAPSLEAKRNGKCLSSVQFYVENPEEEAALIYNKKKAANKAIVELNQMSLEDRKKVATLIGLPISDTDKEEVVYNILDSFLKLPEIKLGQYQGQDPIALFNRVAGMTKQVLTVSALVEKAIKLRVLNIRAGLLYEGDTVVANTKEELISSLCTEKKQMEYLALEAKVNDKNKLKV